MIFENQNSLKLVAITIQLFEDTKATLEISKLNLVLNSELILKDGNYLNSQKLSIFCTYKKPLAFRLLFTKK